jgi:uncharacterized phage protein (TIGR01671 family)
MKRYILFKAKKTKSKTWGFGDYWYNGFTQEHYLKCLIEGGTQFEDVKVDLSTVCQFTGLVDKNGNKIFEDDIVKGGSVIKWWHERALFALFSDALDERPCSYPLFANEIEIIGNLHD